ncbi:MAG: transglycosylase SLT domain-containing protein [Chitinivibrionales bacterium]|nr:transglycosylase SLT domain-containing protein [Chitinivibrionales bacterium]
MTCYYLEITQGIEKGRKFILSDGAMSIGRGTQNAVTMHPSEKRVSGHHAILYKTGDRILIQDLESSNGTFVNEDLARESSLNPGDEIGFGKMGPRLTLKTSETEPDITYHPAGSDNDNFPKPSTAERTTDDVQHEGPLPTSSDSTNREHREAFQIDDDTDSDYQEGDSKTIEFERKLVQKRMDYRDMQKLMKNGGRLERILDRGNLGETQTHLLTTSYHASRKTHKQWIIILGAVLFVSVIAVTYFTIRAYQYKNLLQHGLTLEEMLDNIEKSIAEARKNPDQNKEELKALIAKLEKTKSKLSTVKTHIREDDFGKFYEDPIERKIDEILRRFGETDYHIPEKMVERVKYHVNIYSGRMKRTVARYIGRRDRYFPMIIRIFKEKNMPTELAYISMLESGFNPRALSHAGARGLWQFMPATARRYGLRVDDQVDERLDPEKATYAATEYFKDLISIFGGKSSVMLAMAAYNAGEGRIMRALMKIDDPMRNRDFWYIYRMGVLAEETNEYIPRVIAMMILSENQEEFGFTDGSGQDKEPESSDDNFITLEDLTGS